jgi:hypothetical protein
VARCGPEDCLRQGHRAPWLGVEEGSFRKALTRDLRDEPDQMLHGGRGPKPADTCVKVTQDRVSKPYAFSPEESILEFTALNRAGLCVEAVGPKITHHSGGRLRKDSTSLYQTHLHSDLAVSQIGGFDPPVNVSSISADKYGFVTVTFGGFVTSENGFYVFEPMEKAWKTAAGPN